MQLDHLASDLGDQLCVSAMAVVVAVWCWSQLDRLSAVAFMLAYLIDLTVTTGLKFLSGAIGLPPYAAEPFQLSEGAPSGHVALATVVYGCAAFLFIRCRKSWEALVGHILCLLVIAAIAFTRVTLGTHTIADVIAGFVVGGLIMILPIILFLSRSGLERGMARWLLACMLLVGAVMLASGARMPSGDFNVG
jgi:undecaprenyl-diphosphatase